LSIITCLAFATKHSLCDPCNFLSFFLSVFVSFFVSSSYSVSQPAVSQQHNVVVGPTGISFRSPIRDDQVRFNHARFCQFYMPCLAFAIKHSLFIPFVLPFFFPSFFTLPVLCRA
jgi:hypothetical protein